MDSDSKRVDRLLGQQPAPIPVLHLDEILDRLEKRYDLRLAVSANDDTDWTHIIGHKRNTEAFEPETVNLWTDPASGLLYRLELDWSKSDSERPGPHHISVRLTGQDSLAPDFFRHESHHNEHRPVQPSLPQFTE